MSLNKVQLIGNVGKDPEVRYLDSGMAVATFPLATTDRAYTLANGTQVPERTECITSCYGKNWLKQPKSMCTKAISCILKGKSVLVHTTTRME